MHPDLSFAPLVREGVGHHHLVSPSLGKIVRIERWLRLQHQNLRPLLGFQFFLAVL